MANAGRLLVVDDGDQTKSVLARRLEQSGFAVDVAEDGAAVLDAVQARDVDLVLLDTLMPGLSGIEILKLLRAVRTPDQLPVIVVTTGNDREGVAEALNLGANDYLTKPVDYQIALTRIRSQLSRKHAELALRRSEERFALAARGSRDGLWDWDLESGRVFLSSRWKAMLGYEDPEIGEDPEEWLSRVHADDRSGLEEQLRRHWATSGPGDTFEHEHRMLHRNGCYRWMLCRALVVYGPEHRPLRMAGSQSDITTTKAFDSLTGLPNRLLFLEKVSSALKHSGPDTAFAVLSLDLDRFKVVNESLGHSIGDRLLAAVGERLRHGVRGAAISTERRRHDVIARLGGDEFGVLLEDIGDPVSACRVADRLLAAMRPAFNVGGRELYCSASIGIALRNAGYQSAEEIVRDADTAMYAAKSRGRAQGAVFDGAMRQCVIQRLQMEHDLRKAMELGQFEVQYQPKIHLQSGDLSGFEALVRWNHPERGLLMPEEFIPLAEETGLISAVGMWVLREACRQARRWQMVHPEGRPVEISVNVSARQFRQAAFVEEVAGALEESGLPPASLQLEITETVLLDDLKAAVATLKRLKALGVGLKVDDFGTGYSCLRYLCKLPFDSLKIDRSFTENLAGDSGKSSEVVRTILLMAHNLGMEVVAEGVEDAEQAGELQKLGCEFAQGFYFSKPLSAAEAECLITQPDRRQKAP